jgi:hypothetical protein
LQATQSGITSITMRSDPNAAKAKKATKALYSDPHANDERLDPLNLLQKAERTVADRGRIDEQSEERDRKTESWHTFKTP